MTDQLLATFYVQSPEFPFESVPVTAQLQQQSEVSWWSDSEFRIDITPDNYEDSESGNERHRYRIDVYRRGFLHGAVHYYRPHKAGIYPRRLRVTFNNAFTLERMIYITVQPDLHVYRERTQESGVKSQEDLITTTETVVSQNPLNIQRAVNVLEDTAAQNIVVPFTALAVKY